MTRAWFDRDLDTVATFWRIERRDGVALGFVSHDRDLWFAGLLHRAAPGLLPSAIRRSIAVEPDEVEMTGALDHAAIRADDLAAGRFDAAGVRVGLVDWETGEHETLFAGSIGAVGRQGEQFTAELRSAKHRLGRETIPRTAPTCRAEFCGPGCNLSSERFTRETRVVEVDRAGARVRIDGQVASTFFESGELRWLDGPASGLRAAIVAVAGDWLMLADDPPDDIAAPRPVLLREGCDHTIATCAGRFGNAPNFRGEPFLPGNDLLTRFGNPQG